MKHKLCVIWYNGILFFSQRILDFLSISVLLNDENDIVSFQLFYRNKKFWRNKAINE